jgi:hypothetical protein
LKNIEAIKMVRAGLAGSASFGGIYVLAVVCMGYMGGPTGKWTFEGIREGFFIAICLGLVMGSVFGSRFHGRLKKYTELSAYFGVPLILLGWFLYGFAIRVAVPKDIKLADCTSKSVEVHCKIPYGRIYSIVLVLPPGTSQPVVAHAVIYKETTTITNFIIGSAEAQIQCNYLHAQSNYDMTFTFDQQPPASTTLCLHLLQTHKDSVE